MSQTRWVITVYENRYLNLSAHIKIYLDWNKQGRSEREPEPSQDIAFYVKALIDKVI
jgi:hypothetical protein